MRRSQKRNWPALLVADQFQTNDSQHNQKPTIFGEDVLHGVDGIKIADRVLVDKLDTYTRARFCGCGLTKCVRRWVSNSSIGQSWGLAMDDPGIAFETLKAVTGGKLGIFNVPCPHCSPTRRKQHLRCLRLWHLEPDFLTFNCAHCDAHGFAHAGRGSSIPLAKLKKLKAEAFGRNVAHRQQRRRLARWLWNGAACIVGTLGERYLRSRGITCALPDTLRYRPASGQHPPSIISAFGIPGEPIPGVLSVTRMQIHDLHITRLREDGLAKADVDNPKIMLAPASGMPFVCAPVNDLGGLAICEGLEDALSMHQATGLGAWAAGSAGRLPALARAIPQYVESVTISLDDDDAGQCHGRELAQALRRIRGHSLDIVLLEARQWRSAA